MGRWMEGRGRFFLLVFPEEVEPRGCSIMLDYMVSKQSCVVQCKYYIITAGRRCCSDVLFISIEFIEVYALTDRTTANLQLFLRSCMTSQNWF